MKLITKILLWIEVFLVLGSTLFSAINFSNTFGGQWVCIAKRCTVWGDSDNWISENCRPIGEDKHLECKVIVNGFERIIPLTAINISQAKACKEYACIAKVYLKGDVEVLK